MSDRVAVVGASGFVGGAVAEALRLRGVDARPVRAPRPAPTRPDEAAAAVRDAEDSVARLAAELAGATAVVNAAGLPDAAGSDEPSLVAANAVAAGVVARAARRAGVPRLVHVSSAAVQGAAPLLDSSPRTAPFSPYSRSKALGEALAAEHGAVVYRPPGVHGPGRATTRSLARLARSPLASVAGDGSRPTPQTLIANVADAIAFLATCDQRPPAIVHHPAEGLTTGELLAALGGHPPRHVPRPVAGALVSLLHRVARVRPGMGAQARRLEVLWLGQEQAQSWLTEAGWQPPEGLEAWHALGRELSGDLRR